MRNLRRRKQWNGLVDRLTEEKDPTTSQTAFPTLRELMCFAASLGFEQGKRTPLGEETVDFVEGRVFPRSDIALDLLYLVALASERDVSIVDDEHEEHALTVFEEYANSGFTILDTWIKAHPSDESPIRSLMMDLQHHGYLTQEGMDEGADSDVTFD